MVYFLNPIWLAAAAGIIVPVIIHLWNIRQGKVLRIGSTMLLSEGRQKSSSSLKVSQWLLLLLCSLLIILLAALLAGPQWKTRPTATGKGWVLLDRKDLADIYSSYQGSIDSLLGSGFELHHFDKGFPSFSLSDSAQVLIDSSGKISSPWQLLKMLDAT
ncbi:MAG: hypothetical protein EOP49_50845, partial [Sphingobacteriales bacterium]